MPDSLITDWKCVATSGNTTDGRFIKKEWLEEMAESYDPKTYRARLWVEHMRYSAYGSVAELKAESSGDEVKLFAKISPSRALLQLNAVWEEKLTFSIEPIEDFAKTGKTYLGGLGMTDDPASLGTDEMRFSKLKKNGRDFTARYAGEEVPDLRMNEDDPQVEKLMGKFFKFFSKHNLSEEDEMSQKQLEALTSQVEDLAEQILAFTKTDKKPDETNPKAKEGDDDDAGSPEQFATLLDSVQKLADTQKELGSQFGVLAKKIEETPTGNTVFTENTGSDSEMYV
ncbi:MAG: GPO family capsid scaffolding protein [Desulfotalea sp.]